jgi:uncharacterized membrane protein
MHHWNALIIAHALVASFALFFGAYNLLVSTKGSRTHKMIGRLWAFSMYFVSMSSFWVREINHGQFSIIHILSVVTIITVTMGIYSAKKQNTAAHKGYMRGSYLGLLGAFVAATLVPVRLIPQFFHEHFWQFFALVILITLTAALIIWSTLKLYAEPKKEVINMEGP